MRTLLLRKHLLLTHKYEIYPNLLMSCSRESGHNVIMAPLLCNCKKASQGSCLVSDCNSYPPKDCT